MDINTIIGILAFITLAWFMLRPLPPGLREPTAADLIKEALTSTHTGLPGCLIVLALAAVVMATLGR